MSLFQLPDYFQYPEPYKDGITTEVNIDFDWRDRLKVFLGYRVKVEILTFCENLPGRVESKTAVKVVSNRRHSDGIAYFAEPKQAE